MVVQTKTGKPSDMYRSLLSEVHSESSILKGSFTLYLLKRTNQVPVHITKHRLELKKIEFQRCMMFQRLSSCKKIEFQK